MSFDPTKARAKMAKSDEPGLRHYLRLHAAELIAAWEDRNAARATGMMDAVEAINEIRTLDPEWKECIAFCKKRIEETRRALTEAHAPGCALWEKRKCDCVTGGGKR